LALLLAAAPAFSQDPSTLLRLGGERMVESRCEEAASLLLRAAKGFERLPGATPAQLATAWQALGSAYRCRQLYAKAIEAYGKAFGFSELRRKSEVLLSLASVYSEMLRYQDALDALGRAEQILATLPAEDPEAMAALLSNRSSVERHLGHAAEAGSLLRRAHALLESTPGVDPELLVDVLVNLAFVRASAGDHREAAALCSSAITRSEYAAIPPLRLAATDEFCAREFRRIGEHRGASDLRAKAQALRRSIPADSVSASLVDASQLRKRKRNGAEQIPGGH
jgi:tetratricopeptide (TPR) repeat protein